MNHFARRLAVVGSLLALPMVTWAQGAANPAAGPVNSAMGGAGTALPNESLGALMFNPALITAAGMRAHLSNPKAFAPAGLTPEIAHAEGWTFGVT